MIILYADLIFLCVCVYHIVKENLKKKKKKDPKMIWKHFDIDSVKVKKKYSKWCSIYMSVHLLFLKKD